MKAVEGKLLGFLEGTKQFVIPIYQRPYSWGRRHCKRLWDDVLRTGQNQQIEAHFIGQIVYIEKGLYQVTSVPQLLVIDGQQRLATIMLLLSALTRAMEKNPSKMVPDVTAAKLKKYYFNNEEEGELRYKLLLTKSDNPTMASILDSRGLPAPDARRIADNYAFFADAIAKTSEDLGLIYRGIAKLLMVDISLERGRDNPQLIFESLNSTGLELSQADLIRNYVLMDLEPREQASLYQDYWQRIEANFDDGKNVGLFDRFMRDYLTIKTDQIPNIKAVYETFKTYLRPGAIETTTAAVQEIAAYSEHFARLALDAEVDAELRMCIRDINALHVDVTYPFLMRVYADYTSGAIDREQVAQILRTVESYLLRRAVCRMPTNSLNKVFSNLYKDIIQDSYLESFSAALLLQGSSQRFPTDDEFRNEFMIQSIYELRVRNPILSKLENYNRKETVNVAEYTIEHIMPQNENMPIAWRTEIGPDWQETYAKYLHTIGNLTLTGYNPELSDRPFIEKRDMVGGFRDSPLRLNQSLRDLDKWDEKAIMARAEALANVALQIWPRPELPAEALARYRPRPDRRKREYTLADFGYLTGQTMNIFNTLSTRIMNIHSSVTQSVTGTYIAYKTSTNFVDIIPQKARLRLALNMRFDEVVDPRDLCEDMTGKGRWGNGDVGVLVDAGTDLDYIMSLIMQSFNKHAEDAEE